MFSLLDMRKKRCRSRLVQGIGCPRISWSMWGNDLQGQRQVLRLGSPPHPAGQQRASARNGQRGRCGYGPVDESRWIKYCWDQYVEVSGSKHLVFFISGLSILACARVISFLKSRESCDHHGQPENFRKLPRWDLPRNPWELPQTRWRCALKPTMLLRSFAEDWKSETHWARYRSIFTMFKSPSAKVCNAFHNTWWFPEVSFPSIRIARFQTVVIYAGYLGKSPPDIDQLQAPKSEDFLGGFQYLGLEGCPTWTWKQNWLGLASWWHHESECWSQNPSCRCSDTITPPCNL